MYSPLSSSSHTILSSVESVRRCVTYLATTPATADALHHLQPSFLLHPLCFRGMGAVRNDKLLNVPVVLLPCAGSNGAYALSSEPVTCSVRSLSLRLMSEDQREFDAPLGGRFVWGGWDAGVILSGLLHSDVCLWLVFWLTFFDLWSLCACCCSSDLGRACIEFVVHIQIKGTESSAHLIWAVWSTCWKNTGPGEVNLVTGK